VGDVELMRELADLAAQYRFRAQEMRTIASGVYDHVQRGSFMQFIDEYERLAREVKALDLHVALPCRADGTSH
jgi:hypothetical protein